MGMFLPASRARSHRRRILGGSYGDLVLATGPIAYWPQSEATGTTALCLVNSAQNGTYTGVTLANDNTGPFGTPAPFYDGANDFCDIYSAALEAAYSFDEYTMNIWFKVANVGVWTDTLLRRMMGLEDADNTRRIALGKTAADNRIETQRWDGGVYTAPVINGLVDIGWNMFTVSCTQAGNDLRIFLNGVQSGVPSVGMGVYAGAVLSASQCSIGSESTAPVNVWHGWLAHAAYWTRALSPAEVASLYVT